MRVRGSNKEKDDGKERDGYVGKEEANSWRLKNT